MTELPVCTCSGSELTLISLFDGIGGFPLAFSSAGVRTVATVEIDKAAAGVAAGHFPEAKSFADVTEVTPDELLETGFCPVHGILTAGWPCTDLSLAGLRLGLGGARSGLVGEVFRLLLGVRPRWFVLENVPGLLSSVCPCPGGGICSGPCTAAHVVRGGACGRARNRAGRFTGPGRCMAEHGGGMGTVLRRLGECGYGVAYRILDAQYLGVPQRRRRVVIVGHLGDAAGPVQVLLEPSRGGGHPAAGRAARTRIAAGTGAGAAIAGRSDVAPTLQGGGRRGFRVDAETAAGNGLLVDARGQGVYESAMTASMAGSGGGADDNTAQGGHLVAYQGHGSNVGPMGVLRAGSGTTAGGVPFIAGTLTAPSGKGAGSDVPDGSVIPFGRQVTNALTAEGFDASEDGTGRSTPIVPVDLAQVTSATNRSNPQAGDPNGTPASTRRPAIAFGHTNGIDVQASEQVAPTMRAGHNVGGAVSTAAAVRRLTPTECERLQGFPDRWTQTSHGRAQSDSARYRQLGNSIAVPVFAWVARRLVAVDAASSDTVDQ